MTAQATEKQADMMLEDDVRQEAKRIIVTPHAKLERPEVERHLVQAARANHLTLIAFVDQVYNYLIDELPSDSQHLEWFKKNYPRR